jgi:hypothetical protein
MKTKIDWALGADVRVRGATHIGGEWTLETVQVGPSRCPGAGDRRRASTAPTIVGFRTCRCRPDG